jgi:HSP20 family protein
MARQSLTPFGGFLGGSDPILSLHRQMNRLFDDVMQTPFAGRAGGEGGAALGMVNASMNVSETDNELRVSLELPGVTEEDIDINLESDVLTIRGEKKLEEERGGGKENYHFVERSYGSFQRSLRLPFQANPDEVRASFENGVLTITVPKTAQQQRSRRIQIQRGTGGQLGEQPQQRQGTEIGAESSDLGAQSERPQAGEQPGATH